MTVNRLLLVKVWFRFQFQGRGLMWVMALFIGILFLLFKPWVRRSLILVIVLLVGLRRRGQSGLRGRRSSRPRVR